MSDSSLPDSCTGSLLSTMSSEPRTNDNHCPQVIYDDELRPLYIRTEFVGEGTYGIVYLAEHLSTSKMVVIKEMKRNSDGHSQGIEATQLREVSLLKALNHRNIVRIFDVFLAFESQNLCVVMERCEMDLHQFMRRSQREGVSMKTELIRVKFG